MLLRWVWQSIVLLRKAKRGGSNNKFRRFKMKCVIKNGARIMWLRTLTLRNHTSGRTGTMYSRGTISIIIAPFALLSLNQYLQNRGLHLWTQENPIRADQVFAMTMNTMKDTLSDHFLPTRIACKMKRQQCGNHTS